MTHAEERSPRRRHRSTSRNVGRRRRRRSTSLGRRRASSSGERQRGGASGHDSRMKQRRHRGGSSNSSSRSRDRHRRRRQRSRSRSRENPAPRRSPSVQRPQPGRVLGTGGDRSSARQQSDDTHYYFETQRQERHQRTPLLPPLPPTAGSGLGGPQGGRGPGANSWGPQGPMHMADPRRYRSPPPEFFADRLQIRKDMQRAAEERRLRKEQRRAARKLQAPAVDRRLQPPFLLRVFYRLDSGHTIDQFRQRGREPVEDELQVYAWLDTKLRDICYLIKDVCTEARDRRAVWQFRLVYPDKEGHNVFADVGIFHSIIPEPKEDGKTLADVKFQVGDFLVLSILRKKGNKQLVPRPDPKLKMQESWEIERPSVLKLPAFPLDFARQPLVTTPPAETSAMNIGGAAAAALPEVAPSVDPGADTAPLAIQISDMDDFQQEAPPQPLTQALETTHELQSEHAHNGEEEATLVEEEISRNDSNNSKGGCNKQVMVELVADPPKATRKEDKKQDKKEIKTPSKKTPAKSSNKRRSARLAGGHSVMSCE